MLVSCYSYNFPRSSLCSELDGVTYYVVLAGITPENLFADGWSIGYDDRFPESTRLQQCLLFARFGDDENIYAHPMVRHPFIEFYSVSEIRVGFLPGNRFEQS